MTSPRVLHVSQPVDAGVPAVLLALAGDQVGRGWDVHVACPVEESPLALAAEKLGATVHPWAATRSPGASSLDETRRLGRIIAQVSPSVVVLHSSKAGLAGRLAMRGRRPTVFMPHSWSFEAVTGPVEVASRTWERLAARWTRVTLCVSQAESDRGRAAGCLADEVVVVPNGVDVDDWTPRDRDAARREFGIDPSVRLVVIVGRLARQKGQDVALSGWPAVAREVPGAQLVLVGDGPERAAIEAMAPSDGSVRFVGRSDPRPWLAAADVVALSSRWEGMPLVLLEAMSAGRCVVSTDVAGAREALADDTAVVPVEDSDALAAAIAERLGDPDRCATEGARNRARVVESFDVRVSNGHVAKLVERLARPARGQHRRP